MNDTEAESARFSLRSNMRNAHLAVIVAWASALRSYMRNARLATIAAWGFALRIAVIILSHTYRIRTSENNFGFGFETGRIARSLVLGQGFSNPFHGATGPTAWEAPLYPFIVAAVFKIAGIYTRLSAFLLLSLNSFFSALTVVPVYLIAKKVFGERVALWSAWTWALWPWAMNWAVRWVWETSLTALLLTTAFWLTLEIADADGSRLRNLWLIYGLLWGTIALTNPSCCVFLPFAGLWACFQLQRRKQPWLATAIVSGIIFIAAIIPWEIRDYRVFHKLMPIRGNGGAELRLGNGPGAQGMCMVELHPSQHPPQLDLYREMGEVAYVQMRKQQAVDWMRADPGETARLWMKKIVYYWAGIPNGSNTWIGVQGKNSMFLAWSAMAWWGLGRMLRKSMKAGFLFAALLLTYPAIYYVIFPQLRYRHPIEPVMLTLALFLISEAREFQQATHQSA